jgi:hypothetical protein
MSIRIVASRFSSSISRTARPHESIASECFSKRSPRFRGKSSVATDASTGEGAAAVKEVAAEATSASSGSVPIGMTSVAMAIAIATVSAGAALAENVTASLVPTFDPKQQRFDQSTFTGRLSKMLLACDPSLVFYSNEEVRRCKAMVDDYEFYLNNLPEGVSVTEMSRRLWEAQVCETLFSLP